MPSDAPMWTPDHPVDTALAAALVRAQFPALADAPPVHVGRGFDVDAWRFGEWVFRFPRRRIAVELVATERRVLGGLAPRLPVAVPRPELSGEPGEAYPAGFYAHRYLPGTTADRAGLDDAARAALAPAVGRFLRALHGIPVAEAAALGVPADTFRSDNAARSLRALGQLAWLEGTRWAASLDLLRERLAAPPPRAEPEPVALLHGDLYARHLLLDGTGALSAVIDWGDVCLGDPAIDMAIAYTFLPASARAAFWAAYGEVDAAMRERARYIALSRHAVLLLAYALDVGDTVLEAEAGRAIAHALA